MLEPTRLLVNQVSDCFRNEAGVDAVPIDGRIPREQRLRLWSEPLVVCTAQTALNDWEHVRARAAVIDECHHTVGQHAFKKLLEKCRFELKDSAGEQVPIVFNSYTPVKLKSVWWCGVGGSTKGRTDNDCQ